MVLADKLYKLRKDQKLAQEELALELEVSKTALINWENNKSKPSIDNLMKICDFYETDIYTLLEEVSNVNFSHATFNGSNYVVHPNNSTINFNSSPELIAQITDNHGKINVLFEQEINLFEKLLGNKS
jgi:transcriptional regulator with XRE-family HTH domain